MLCVGFRRKELAIANSLGQREDVHKLLSVLPKAIYLCWLDPVQVSEV